MPKLSMPGAVLVGDAGGMVDTVALKGVHHAIQSGKLAAEAIYAPSRRGTPLENYERDGRAVLDGQGAVGGPQHAPALPEGNRCEGGRSRQPGAPDEGEAAVRPALHGTATIEQPMFVGDTSARYPKPDGKYIFDKLSSVYISGNATRDDAPNHIRVQRRVPREIAEAWRWMCPAGVYEIPDDAAWAGPSPGWSTSSSTTPTASNAARSRRRAAG